MVPTIDTKAKFDEVLADAKSNNKAVIVDFTATWCGPCKMIGPKFVELAGQYTGLVFIKVDVDENDETAAFCKVEAMPTFMVFKDGEKVDEMVGASPPKLEELCQKYNN